MAHHQAPKIDNSSDTSHEVDGRADAFAATAIIAIIVISVSYWLHGMA